MNWLGLDVGGANLKAADGRGWARIVAFPLWRDPEGLTGAIAGLLARAPAADRLAVTMTGELCDCFGTKAEGVRHILSAVEQGAGRRETLVYLVDGRLVPVDQAREVPSLAAASNWHALARFVCRYTDCEYTVSSAGLLIDVGSTTSDIVPLVGQQPGPTAFNDTDRLVSGELVYTGVGRTPVCAITSWLPWRGVRCPVAAELFATAADAYVILGDLPEEPGATWTADGRGLTKELARGRLARMICADPSTFDEADAERAAKAVRAAQLSHLQEAVERVATRMAARPACVVLSGEGEFLAAEVVRRCLPSAKLVSLAGKLGSDVSRAAPAHALAVIAREAGPQNGPKP